MGIEAVAGKTQTLAPAGSTLVFFVPRHREPLAASGSRIPTGDKELLWAQAWAEDMGLLGLAPLFSRAEVWSLEGWKIPKIPSVAQNPQPGSRVRVYLRAKPRWQKGHCVPQSHSARKEMEVLFVLQAGRGTFHSPAFVHIRPVPSWFCNGSVLEGPAWQQYPSHSLPCAGA